MPVKNKISVYVEKANDGTYWASTQNIPGGISAFGYSMNELKKNLKIALDDYLEVAKDQKEDWLPEVEKMNSFEYVLDIPSFFKLLPELKISAIAQKAKINASLVRQYASGKTNASEKQAKKIEKAIHELGEELLAISL